MSASSTLCMHTGLRNILHMVIRLSLIIVLAYFLLYSFYADKVFFESLLKEINQYYSVKLAQKVTRGIREIRGGDKR